jgi:16S rRNA (cytosine967-C5)-methyltransferase
MGTLRYRAQLDHLIERYSGREQPKLDPEVRIALHMAIFQLRYLDRIPAHAAVAESVDLVKQAHKRSAAGFVNAVLRKVNRSPIKWPSRQVELSTPEWMLRRWEQQFGRETADKIARASLTEPEAYIRVPEGEDPPRRAKPTDIPGCYLLMSGDPGPYRYQDIGSQAIVPLLNLKAGQTLLDLCAAPGNKTAQALETDIRCFACDRSRVRLIALAELGIPLIVTDAAGPLPFAKPFDRILVDAPCSGTGTLSRNPEIKWRLEEEDLHEQAWRQQRILSNALELLAPEGRLVYSTCSLEPEENQQVVDDTLATKPGFRLVQTLERIPGRDPGDGFFAAVIERKPA